MTAGADEADLVFQKVVEFLTPFNTDGGKLTRDTVITADLDIDSVAVLDVIMNVEDTYDLTFPINQIAETRTIGELVDAIHDLKRQQEAAS